MKLKNYIVLIASVVVSAFVQAAEVRDGHMELVNTYVNVVNNKSEFGYRSIVHSKSLACITPANKAYFDYLTKTLFNTKFAKDYEVSASVVQRADLYNFEKLLGHNVKLPVAPTHFINLTYKDVGVPEMCRTDAKEEKAIYVASENDSWKIVVPCIKDQALPNFKESQAKESAERDRVNKIVSEIPKEIKDQVVGHLQNGKRIKAIRTCSVETGLSLKDAKKVVQNICMGSAN
jgi:hypothetical protein